jgi:hypothetical protein
LSLPWSLQRHHRLATLHRSPHLHPRSTRHLHPLVSPQRSPQRSRRGRQRRSPHLRRLRCRVRPQRPRRPLFRLLFRLRRLHLILPGPQRRFRHLRLPSARLTYQLRSRLPTLHTSRRRSRPTHPPRNRPHCHRPPMSRRLLPPTHRLLCRLHLPQ